MTSHDQLADNLQRNRITRRQVLWLLGAGLAAAAAALIGEVLVESGRLGGAWGRLSRLAGFHEYSQRVSLR